MRVDGDAEQEEIVAIRTPSPIWTYWRKRIVGLIGQLQLRPRKNFRGLLVSCRQWWRSGDFTSIFIWIYCLYFAGIPFLIFGSACSFCSCLFVYVSPRSYSIVVYCVDWRLLSATLRWSCIPVNDSMSVVLAAAVSLTCTWFLRTDIVRSPLGQAYVLFHCDHKHGYLEDK